MTSRGGNTYLYCFDLSTNKIKWVILKKLYDTNYGEGNSIDGQLLPGWMLQPRGVYNTLNSEETKYLWNLNHPKSTKIDNLSNELRTEIFDIIN